jgi:MFS family permease
VTGLSTAAVRPPLYRNREFMILWTSQAVSTVGTRVTTVAYPLLVLGLTGSPAQAGLVAFAQTLPYLVWFLPAGALVDRWDRKRVMILCEVGRAIALGSVAVAIALGTVTIVQLVVVAFIEGSLFVFFDLCEGAALPRIVPPEQLPAAVAQNQARQQGADLVGQPLGGALFSISTALPFLFDAISYFVSIGAMLFIRTPLQEVRKRAPTRLRDEVVEGLRVVLNQPFLRTSVLLIAGINFAFNGMALALIFRAQELGASPALIGLMFGFYGAGALIGAVGATWINRRFAERTIIVTIAWFWALETAALVLMPDVLTLGIVAAAGALAGPPFNVVFASVVYRTTPDRLLGRVRSVIKLVAWGTIPLGALAAGLLASALSAIPTLLILAGVMLVVAVATTFAPGIRHLPPATVGN